MGTMDEQQRAPEQPPRPAGEAGTAAARYPTVDDMGEWSFPASDPPATWTWEPRPAKPPT
jgi:hypothetical protein